MTDELPVQVDRGQGPPVVLLHGLGNNFRSWTYVLEKFDGTRNRVIALDLLGFGDAPKPDHVRYTVDDHADAVIATLDRLGVVGATVAGHSMGCLVAARVALERDDLVSRLVLLGSPVFRRITLRRNPLTFWERESTYLRIFRFISEQPDLTLTAAEGLDTFAPMVKGMEITEETWPAFTMSLENTIMQTTGYADLLRLTQPTELVYGKLDAFVISRNLRAAARHNRSLVYSTLLGPHEISPLEGQTIADLLQHTQG
ncbi:MAG: alpha/beta hydrolase [Lapillicoccus sp.]